MTPYDNSLQIQSLIRVESSMSIKPGYQYYSYSLLCSRDGTGLCAKGFSLGIRPGLLPGRDHRAKDADGFILPRRQHRSSAHHTPVYSHTKNRFLFNQNPKQGSQIGNPWIEIREQRRRLIGGGLE